MQRNRHRAFEREIKHISAVAGEARAPLQLSLDEQLPGRVHGEPRTVPTDYGYIAHCACGWHSGELAAKRSAQHAYRAHVGRTPQGTAALRTLRRVGRAGAGA